MKILLVNPCLRRNVPHRFLPVGLGYVATAVKEAGYDFDLLDIDLHQQEDDEVERFIRRRRYDVIALGSIVTHYKWVKWFVHLVKSCQPACQVIVGNSVGSSIPSLFLGNAPADVIILGEADVTIVEVLDALSSGRPLGGSPAEPWTIGRDGGAEVANTAPDRVEGIVFRHGSGAIVDNGTRRAVRKIDDLPYPDWDLFEVERYLELASTTAHDTVHFPAHEAVVMPVNTARGCVYKCTFCHYVFWNDPYRHRSAESILGEIRRNQSKYGANYINFWDELSFSKLDQAERIADALLEADLKIHWTAAVRSDLFGRTDIPREKRLRVAEKFRRAGALTLGYSLESANQEILDAMNKRVKREYFAEQIRLLNEVGILSNTSLVLGYPQETLDTVRETMQFCLDLGIYPSVGYLLALPATGMWEHALQHGHIRDQDDYLSTITERQDLSLNMTSVPSDLLESEVKKWLEKINSSLDMRLDPDRLIRTGGYNKHTKTVQSLNRSRNTVDSLSYAKVAGGV